MLYPVYTVGLEELQTDRIKMSKSKLMSDN